MRTAYTYPALKLFLTRMWRWDERSFEMRHSYSDRTNSAAICCSCHLHPARNCSPNPSPASPEHCARRMQARHQSGCRKNSAALQSLIVGRHSFTESGPEFNEYLGGEHITQDDIHHHTCGEGVERFGACHSEIAKACGEAYAKE